MLVVVVARNFIDNYTSSATSSSSINLAFIGIEIWMLVNSVNILDVYTNNCT